VVTNESENDDEPNVTPPPSPEGDDNVSIFCYINVLLKTIFSLVLYLS